MAVRHRTLGVETHQAFDQSDEDKKTKRQQKLKNTTNKKDQYERLNFDVRAVSNSCFIYVPMEFI